MTGYEVAYEHPVLNSVLASLQRGRLAVPPATSTASAEEFRQAAWLASVLANSDEHRHRQRALLFAALARQSHPDDANLEALCYAIFSRAGTLPAAMHLTSLVDGESRYVGPTLGPLSEEFHAAHSLAYSPLGGGIVLTDFQRRLAEAVAAQDATVISAPTSAGKSFIIHEYVKSRFRDGAFAALLVVPTKALIAQVCSLYRRFSYEEGVPLSILSSVPSESFDPPLGNTVLALTQERCIRLIATPFARRLDFVFVDEIQELEAGDRGALLEYVVHELRRSAADARFFAAGPFIGKPGALSRGLFDRPSEPLETQDSPVSQMVVHVRPVKGRSSLKLKVVDLGTSGSEIEFDLPTPRQLFSRWKGNQGRAVTDALDLFAGDSQSIVYAKGKGTAQAWARLYADTFDPLDDLDPEIEQLIEFIRDFIHPACSLIDCLRRRVAYHHAGLTDFVREEIESLFIEQKLDVLFCTSTLIAGVNLPAEKIFVLTAKKANEDLRPLEFRNLIGRAGRLDRHLCGYVYCLQIPNEASVDWIDKFREDDREEVKPTVAQKLSTHFAEIERLMREGLPVTTGGFERKLHSSVIILRMRRLKGRAEVEKYLSRKDLSDAERRQLLDDLDRLADDLEIPPRVALKNPTVDPYLQDQLYRVVRADPAAWNMRRPHVRGFAADLKSVFKRLDEIFKILDEMDPLGDPKIYRDKLLRFAGRWLEGESFRDMVIWMLPRSEREALFAAPEAVDKAILRTMEMISKDIAFVMVKYFSVLAEVLRAILPDEDAERYGAPLSLPVWLEFGSADQRANSLMSACLPRAVALRVARLIPLDVEDTVAWLAEHRDDQSVRQLPPLFQKLLRRSGIWPRE